MIGVVAGIIVVYFIIATYKLYAALRLRKLQILQLNLDKKLIDKLLGIIINRDVSTASQLLSTLGGYYNFDQFAIYDIVGTNTILQSSNPSIANEHIANILLRDTVEDSLLAERQIDDNIVLYHFKIDDQYLFLFMRSQMSDLEKRDIHSMVSIISKIIILAL